MSLLRISVEENETAEVKLPQTSAGWVGSTSTEKLSESLGKCTVNVPTYSYQYLVLHKLVKTPGPFRSPRLTAEAAVLASSKE